jgi:hypothetical protein
MASNREAAEALLHAASLSALASEDPGEPAAISAVAAIGFALLDVADAIREQNEMIRPSFRNSIDVDI